MSDFSLWYKICEYHVRLNGPEYEHQYGSKGGFWLHFFFDSRCILQGGEQNIIFMERHTKGGEGNRLTIVR